MKALEHISNRMVPICTSEHGMSLTAQNWQEVGIEMLSFHLETLLIKPGFDLLSTLPHLASYVGWAKQLVLNARFIPKNPDDEVYEFRSHFDGRMYRYSLETLLPLIIKLQASIVILPYGVLKNKYHLWNILPETTFPFLSAQEVLESPPILRPYGVYFVGDEYPSKKELQHTMSSFSEVERYLMGHLPMASLKEWMSEGVFVETDNPASDACSGTVYLEEENLSIEEPEFGMQFQPIDSTCHCPTCRQLFTRAYLHHLFTETPLLCQRLLIQHNIYAVARR